MIKTTRAQREALFRVFQRDFPSWISPTERVRHHDLVPGDYEDAKQFAKRYPHLIVKTPSIQYRRFRKNVHRLWADNGCVMVHWCGVWLGIETDGHIHS